MPTEIPIEGKPSKEIKIQGFEIFEAPMPYEAGHVLRDNEASVLNQTYHENLRNNYASDVAAAIEAAEEEGGAVDIEALKAAFVEYVGEYDFGERKGGFRTSDPVLQLAMERAREMVRKMLKRKGYKLKDIGGKKVSELAKKLVDSNPELKEWARQQVEAAKEIGISNADDLLADLDNEGEGSEA